MADYTKKCKENAFNFLLYSYFAISKKELNSKEIIINIAVKKAYDDATLMGAYKYKTGGSQNKNSVAAYEECFDELTSEKSELGILNLIASKNQGVFNDKHKDICKLLVSKHKEKLGSMDYFTYGNAQKWVNMTTKYLYIFVGLIGRQGSKSLQEFCNDVKDCSEFFHVPIDQIILRALINPQIVQDEEIKKFIYSKGSGVGCCKNKDKFILAPKRTRGITMIAWSGFASYDFYDDFRQEIIKVIPDGKNPIEWECEAWIKQSEEDIASLEEKGS